jgi:hypothetical protein
MFAKAFVATLALVGAVSAVPTGGSGSTCPTSGAQCCQNVQNSSNAGVAALVKSLIGIDVSALNVPIGTGCTPLDILGGVQCNQNTVYCGTAYQSTTALSHLVNTTNDIRRRSDCYQLHPYHHQRLDGERV